MATNQTIRVMIVDDHAVVRSGLKAFLDAYDDLQLAGEARSGEEAVRLCAQIQPDVVLMDLVMSGMDGASATKAIRLTCPHTQVVVLTTFKDEAMIQKAISAGAIGYLLKDVQADELAEAIRLTNAGRTILSPEITQALVHGSTRGNQPGSDLSERELEVLSWMVQGLNNTEISNQMILSLSTVKHHVSNILGKLNVTNRAEAVAMAVQHNLAKYPSQK
jgi:NarL family two-component system response regulator LiaR